MSAALGVLVAGGSGRRLAQGRPKAHATLAGETLLARALAALAPACGEVVISLSPGVVAPDPLPDGVFVTHDREGTKGPLAGLVAGLEARPFEIAIVLGVDFPLARTAALAAIAARLERHAAVVPSPLGRAQPLFAAYSRAALAPLVQALERGEQALVPAVLALDPLMLDDAALARLEGGLGNFLNVNRPEDLAEAAKRLGSGPAAGAA